MIEWVDKNVDTNSEPDGAFRSSGMVPGHYEIPDDGFDWSILDIDPKYGSIRIITRGTRLKPVFSVSFTEISRVSILVRTRSSQHFGLEDKKEIRNITDRVAVFCYSPS